MADVTPFPKSQQLARGEKRTHRRKATREEWQGLRAAKLGTCRAHHGRECDGRIELHHLVPRSWGGDDVRDNLVPLCRLHHHYVTVTRHRVVHDRLAESLTDGEYAYIIDKLGEGGMERLFGIEYARAGEERPQP